VKDKLLPPGLLNADHMTGSIKARSALTLLRTGCRKTKDKRNQQDPN